MFPTREEAERLLKEAVPHNPGPWEGHSRVAAHCAEKIAEACDGLDPEKAYVMGLLHDIGRRFGVRHLGHVSDGFSYMMSLGYDEVARICLTHSFHTLKLEDYVGRQDVSEEEMAFILSELTKVQLDDYDMLIQLCDTLAGGDRVMDMEDRMDDVMRRYGSYPQEKREAKRQIRKYFEEWAGRDIYEIVEKDTYRLTD